MCVRIVLWASADAVAAAAAGSVVSVTAATLLSFCNCWRALAHLFALLALLLVTESSRPICRKVSQTLRAPQAQQKNLPWNSSRPNLPNYTQTRLVCRHAHVGSLFPHWQGSVPAAQPNQSCCACRNKEPVFSRCCCLQKRGNKSAYTTSSGEHFTPQLDGHKNLMRHLFSATALVEKTSHHI